jgi:hypothetical protein
VFKLFTAKAFNTENTGKPGRKLRIENSKEIYLPDKNGKCADAAMKNSNGRLSQKLICMVSVAVRANFIASGGMGVPCSANARVHLISRF